MFRTSDALKEEFSLVGGGKASGLNTDKDGHESSNKASVAVPNSQLAKVQQKLSGVVKG
jgi:hypothetical protein